MSGVSLVSEPGCKGKKKLLVCKRNRQVFFIPSARLAEESPLLEGVAKVSFSFYPASTSGKFFLSSLSPAG
jgi:hypothetical protein